jgi:hypothetical protein
MAKQIDPVPPAARASEPFVVCAKLVESTRIDAQMPAAEETSWRTAE